MAPSSISRSGGGFGCRTPADARSRSCQSLFPVGHGSDCLSRHAVAADFCDRAVSFPPGDRACRHVGRGLDRLDNASRRAPFEDSCQGGCRSCQPTRGTCRRRPAQCRSDPRAWHARSLQGCVVPIEQIAHCRDDPYARRRGRHRRRREGAALRAAIGGPGNRCRARRR